jgi:hypothetical protein
MTDMMKFMNTAKWMTPKLCIVALTALVLGLTLEPACANSNPEPTEYSHGLH